MTEVTHGLITSYKAMVIECTCGDVLVVNGAEGVQEFIGAHAQGDKPLHPSADAKAHAATLGRIKILKEK